MTMRFLLSIVLFVSFHALVAQTTIFFQGFEGSASDTWPVSGTWERNDQGGVNVNNKRTGTYSARIGRGTGGSGAPAGLSNGPHTLTMSVVNLTGYTGVVVRVYTSTASSFGGSGHGTGTGLDANEQATVQFRLNGGAWTTFDQVSGSSNYIYGWNTTTIGSGGCGYTMSNPMLYNVPAGTTTLQIRIYSGGTCASTGSNYDRADEGIYIDDIQVTGTSTLPIELISFGADLNDQMVKTSWITASEQNTEWHVVERSAEGFDFYEIGRLPAAGNSNQPIAYVLNDPAPLNGISYYRLKTLDFDGYTSYSHIVPVHTDSKTTFTVFYNGGNVFIQSKNDEVIMVYDVRGALLREITINAGQTVALQGFEAGVYFLKGKMHAASIKTVLRN